MGRPRLHDDATREALLGAAEALVEAGGPGALSVRAAADTIGTSTRAVYSIFGSKEGLLSALAQRSFELLRDKNLRNEVGGLLDVLDDREKKIIFQRFGLDGGSHHLVAAPIEQLPTVPRPHWFSAALG